MRDIEYYETQLEKITRVLAALDSGNTVVDRFWAARLRQAQAYYRRRVIELTQIQQN